MSTLLNKDIKDYFKDEFDILEDSKKKNIKINRESFFYSIFSFSFSFLVFLFLILFGSETDIPKKFLLKGSFVAFGVIIFLFQFVKDLARKEYRRLLFTMILFSIGISTALTIVR